MGAGATVKTKNEKVKSGREVYEEAKSQVKRMTEMGGSCARAGRLYSESGIEYTDNAIDLVAENFSFIVTVEMHNFIKFSPYSAITKGQHHVFTVTFGQMQTDMRDVTFCFGRKTDIKISGSWLADVVLGGDVCFLSFTYLVEKRCSSEFSRLPSTPNLTECRSSRLKRRRRSRFAQVLHQRFAT